ncbi:MULTISPECIES: serine/threonine protein kinase [unclassified Halomonas]|uniref:serine/threonine protein kinase n=1 Tax=unclassified Halomonas TaxID=2609666 RepID=UPI0007D9BD68|nr:MULTISPECIES: serine/threonine protein kinase [unclassified Halomonas]MBT2788146.1 serine/threonine protein kinase [Halomonas sp. ISL-106]MBT2795895.1 serine/threonine protein kinase [Halomonas sp. ISL-104]OAL61178.1 stress response serine/threonine protein kinase YihE [Halomonas sp. ALS9]
MSHPFSSLSPDLVMSAVESLDIWPAGEPFALNSYENRVLMFRDDDGKSWIVKFYRPDRWSDSVIQEEHDFLQELVDQQVPVVAPWRNEAGASLHYFKDFRFTLFPHCSGQAPELDNPSHLFAMGELLGRLHDVSAKKTFQHRPRLEMASGILDAQQRVLASHWMNSHQRRAYDRVIEKVHQQLIKHDVPTGSLIRCHGDCHLGNVLGRDEQFTLVDFDDCTMAPAMQDIWMLLPTDDPQGWRSQLSEIIEGYEETRSFPNEQMALIEPLRSYRLIRHSAWLVSRWDDPAFPRAFPWLADSGYWDQHIRQLEQQCLQLENPRWLA